MLRIKEPDRPTGAKNQTMNRIKPYLSAIAIIGVVAGLVLILIAGIVHNKKQRERCYSTTTADTTYAGVGRPYAEAGFVIIRDTTGARHYLPPLAPISTIPCKL